MEVSLVYSLKDALKGGMCWGLALRTSAFIAQVVSAETNVHEQASVLGFEDLDHLRACLIVATISRLSVSVLVLCDLSLGHASLLANPFLTIQKNKTT